VTKVLEMSNPGAGRSSAVTRPLIVRGFFNGLNAYREMVDVEIGRASENGARWWSRRLVDMSEQAGLVRLEK
jgi:hypothetical protein